MGKAWDAWVPGPEVWRECYRVLKPGGHALVFAGTRSMDLMCIALRLAGFELRDSIGYAHEGGAAPLLAWAYGSGFPKSHSISKAIDREAGAEREVVEAAERRVHRFVGFTFFALAAYVLTVAIWTLVGPGEPEESLVGIILAVASLIVMPLVSWGKLRAAREIPSSALRAEAKETLACSYLSFALLLGLAANAVAGWWWADPVAALLMIPWLVREGWEGVVGEEDED